MWVFSQRRPFLLENDDGLSLAGQYAGRGWTMLGCVCLPCLSVKVQLLLNYAPLTDIRTFHSVGVCSSLVCHPGSLSLLSSVDGIRALSKYGFPETENKLVWFCCQLWLRCTVTLVFHALFKYCLCMYVCMYGYTDCEAEGSIFSPDIFCVLSTAVAQSYFCGIYIILPVFWTTSWQRLAVSQ